jgi:hypothetical protein
VGKLAGFYDPDVAEGLFFVGGGFVCFLELIFDSSVLFNKFGIFWVCYTFLYMESKWYIVEWINSY